MKRTTNAIRNAAIRNSTNPSMIPASSPNKSRQPAATNPSAVNTIPNPATLDTCDLRISQYREVSIRLIDPALENRFSLLWDIYSGPAVFVVSNLVEQPTTALGIEAGTALALRYTLGPLTGEARGVVGGRAGATTTPFPEAEEGGPFSLLYAGGELGLTWSF